MILMSFMVRPKCGNRGYDARSLDITRHDFS